MAHALSDSTIDKILNIETMRHLNKNRKEAEKLHQYLIRVIDVIQYLIAGTDGTIDITFCEQTSIALRYVTLAAEKTVVKKYLILIVETGTTNGEGVSEKIKDEFKLNNVNIQISTLCVWSYVLISEIQSMISRDKSGYEKRKERQKDMKKVLENDDYCDNGNIDSDPLSARNETEFVGISAQFDISTLSLYTDCANINIGEVKINISPKDVKDAILRGPEPLPTTFPVDKRGYQFPTYLLSFRLKNKEIVPRGWLVWSKSKNALFYFRCRLFYKFHEKRSIFATENGWQANRGYKKLYDKMPDHEKSSNHKSCYIQWRNLEKNIYKHTTIDCFIVKQIQNETQKWKDLFKRLLDVILFLAERGFAFRGVNHLIGDSNNRNFLGLLELLSHYDPLLEEHLKIVKQTQIER
ncbi:uncharacterized protein LOC136074295 [Hydra vulgaris]|uniref:Uncharacterized protein LOC136074295 n=1 Tax=Hydra vulgaris TaxID=6087 RepID=A0ABM4B1L5_HYDVU